MTSTGALRRTSSRWRPAPLRARGPALSARLRRENYLGHSLHGQIGRWTTTARGSDLTWWSEGRSQLNRSEADEAKAKQEKQMVKEAEEDAMREAMCAPTGSAARTAAAAVQLRCASQMSRTSQMR